MQYNLQNSDLLRAERKRRGWSQMDVAQALGVDVTTVRRWERGQVAPYPYHRRRLSILFGKTAEELGLFPNIDEEKDAPSTDTLSDTLIETSMLTDPSTAEPFHAAGYDVLKPIKQPLSPRSLWGAGSGSINRVPTFRPLNRLSWLLFFSISMILPTALLMVVVLPTFYQQPSSSNSHAQDHFSPPFYALATPTTDPSLQNIIQHLHQAFTAIYPQVVNRFALDPATAPRNVTLTFASDSSSSAAIHGTTITLNATWMREHPGSVGLLTHQLTLLVVQYPSGTPTWFSEGIADYARSLYGPVDDSDWSLPNNVQAQESYTQGGAVTARFLLWLEQHTRLDIVDQLNHALQIRQSLSSVFHRLTHYTIDELWRQYQASPAITLTPEQLYKTAISRKPLYQSSFRLQGSQSYYAYAEGLDLSNFAMQADITIVSGDNDSKGGLFFRSNDLSRDVAYLSASGYYRLDTQDQYGPLTYSSAIKVGLNQTNRLTIIVQKYSIYLYINSQFITKVDDNRLLSYGTLGVETSWYTAPPDIRFDNFQVF